MVSNTHIISTHRQTILALAERHGAGNVRLFGSFARGDADDRSDIDLLVDMQPGRSLLDVGGLVMDLRQLLGIEVDVVTERPLRPSMRERVLRDAVEL